MNEIWAEGVKAFVGLLSDALKGDAQAQARIAHILPRELQTRIVAAAQDRLDVEKFGRRSSTPPGSES